MRHAIICDRCGKTGGRYHHFGWFVHSGTALFERSIDLCPDCRTELYIWLDDETEVTAREELRAVGFDTVQELAEAWSAAELRLAQVEPEQ